MNPTTSFDNVLGLYIFDRELRLLLLDAIERVEVSVRSQWAYQMAHHHGAHSHLDNSLANDLGKWDKNIEALSKDVNRSTETFIMHFKNNYSESLPPVWAACEVMSLGLFSRWYANLKPKKTRSAIASVYNLDESLLKSWLHHLAYVRNICAHHGRLWNREFTLTPQPPRSKPNKLINMFQRGSRRIYNSLLMLLYLMDVIAPNHCWRGRLVNLLNQQSTWITQAMDLPQDWQNLNIWKVT